uniref:Glycerol-3-phosphate dehydrogenase [NAD(+)] n=1 Tax=Cajanus cajan TaxID=3821 RepID=A0A151U031_CAJCA|nr:Glycerol-3-phosphate dehydrogenase [NAD(P)+] [Cajanus cajan]
MAAVLEAPLATPFFSSKPHNTNNIPSKFHTKPSFLTFRVTSRAANASLSPTQDPDPNPDSEPDPTRDRRRIVRVAWEKLVRWSRSWRSKANTDVLQRTNKVVVLGGGSFGTAMAAHVANRKAELEVKMLVRDPQVCLSINESHCNRKYFPDHSLPENVVATTDAKSALVGADYCLHAVPVQEKPYWVKVGDGYSVKAQGMCAGLKMELQGVPLRQNFYLFALDGVDVILGMEWLRGLGEIKANFDKRTLKVKVGGEVYQIKGDSSLSVSEAPLKGTLKQLKEEEEIYWVECCVAETESEEKMRAVPDSIQQLLEEFEEMQALIQKLVIDPDQQQGYELKEGKLFFKGKLVLPRNSSRIPLIIQEFHASAMGGHAGVFRTFKRVSAAFFWKGMKKDITKFVTECHICQTNKYQTLAPGGLLQPLPILTQIWTDLSMDFIGGLPKALGKDTILVVVDRLSKYAHFLPLSHPYSTQEVAQVFIQEVVRLHGFPESIVTDRDKLFLSQFWSELFKSAGTKLKYTSAYHPFSASFLESVSEYVDPGLPFISLSKGLELNTLRMMAQIIPQALRNPRQPFVALSGPSFALELMDKLPTAMVVASKDKKLANKVQQLLASSHLRISTSSDVTGVEIAGALKNVLAIAAGIVEGMNLGNNSMAALVSQGCSEIRWLATKMGAKPTTITGLSGTGDIMLTCFVNLSRNRTVGVRLGSGEKLENILNSMNQVAEGVSTAGAVIALAQKYNVKMPVLTAVARIIDNELTPKKAVFELMSLPQVILTLFSEQLYWFYIKILQILL